VWDRSDGRLAAVESKRRNRAEDDLHLGAVRSRLIARTCGDLSRLDLEAGFGAQRPENQAGMARRVDPQRAQLSIIDARNPG
jgi:hypothetical protein